MFAMSPRVARQCSTADPVSKALRRPPLDDGPGEVLDSATPPVQYSALTPRVRRNAPVMDDTPNSGPGRAHPAKRLGRRATLKLLGLAVTGAATLRSGEAAASSFGQASAAAPKPAAARRRGRAWTLRPLATGTAPQALEAAEFAALA